MTEANPVAYDARNPKAPIAILAAHAVAGRPKLATVRAYSPPAAGRPAATAGREVREEPEYYVPELLSDRDYEPDPELINAAYAHSEGLRDAMALIDDAENLLAVLVASTEEEADSRAMQADTVLKIVRKKLNKAHTRIDRQESRHRNLFVAYFELKERAVDENES